MDPALQPIILGTRGSGLALAQTHMMLDVLRQTHPQFRFDFKIIKTAGDMPTRPAVLPDSGVKGLFTREIEVALTGGRADIAVHSLKDLPTALPSGLILAATPKRADARDVLISRGPRLDELPQGAVVATSSLRRKGQLLALRPDLKLVEIRGNVETRLRKLQENAGWQGTVLAAAGLARLNLNLADWSLVAHPFAPEEMLPAPCQAILGLEARGDDARVLSLLRPINHDETFQVATAERAFSHVLEGGCRTPIAAYAEVTEGRLRLRGAVFHEDGRVRFRDEVGGDAREAEQIGKTLAEKAKTILK
ncbi:MAG: hydroxymethylbilane synthase [Verrucomicrobia bacterium]|nr:hydroxymethylbilane synthase [Verrucomicrobiota bacterium]